MRSWVLFRRNQGFQRLSKVFQSTRRVDIGFVDMITMTKELRLSCEIRLDIFLRRLGVKHGFAVVPGANSIGRRLVQLYRGFQSIRRVNIGPNRCGHHGPKGRDCRENSSAKVGFNVLTLDPSVNFVAVPGVTSTERQLLPALRRVPIEQACQCWSECTS